jgi:putative transposase
VQKQLDKTKEEMYLRGMPRQARLDAPGTLHHIMGRGIEGVKIYRNPVDRKDFIKRIGALCQAGQIRLYAWALMPNHFHLLVRSENRPISYSMRKLLTGYAVNFNKRHKRLGHLFQNRYKSIVCEEDPYLLELTRYIHLNPLRAGLVKNLDELKCYQWSGHSCLMGTSSYEFQDTETILAYFNSKRKIGVKKYESFIAEGIVLGKRPELTGGGLVRSMGGWFEVISQRRKGERAVADQRVLGSGEYIKALYSEADKKQKETLRLLSQKVDLSTVTKLISGEEGIREEDLRTGKRMRRIVNARKIFCQLTVNKMGYSGADVARFLGISTSAVNRMAASSELPELANFLKLL